MMTLPSKRGVLALTHDIVAIAAAWSAAYAIRFNFEDITSISDGLLNNLPWIVPIQALLFFFSGLYRGIWRYASLRDLRQIIIAIALGTTAIAMILLFARPLVTMPRTVLIVAPILLMSIMTGSRLLARMWREHYAARLTANKGEPVIVLGAGDSCANLLREMQRSSRWRAVALLDDDPRKKGRLLNGVKVVGRIEDFPLVSAQLGVMTAILAMPSVEHGARKHIIDFCSKAGAQVLTVPSFDELVGGHMSVDRVRRVSVEDLLGRDTVQLDTENLHRMYDDRSILITGAGGSIGAELARQLARFRPGLLVLLDSSEFALYKLREEFVERFPEIRIITIVGDIKHAARIDKLMAEYRPSVLLHAAAYKHVPLMEENNAWEALRNNSFGTLMMANAAIKHGVERFVLISTDKAVNPTNVMGASKRLAEMVCQASQHAGRTRFEIVRFGNVLGSNGSVIPKFEEQIARGGPVTVTHPEIIRYFMSIPEAAQLVLQAGAMGQGGEVFVLDMGEPVRIAQLARDMIRLSGHTEEQIKIVFTGLRPGEKLYEELLADGEKTQATPHPKVRIARAMPVTEQWLAEFGEFMRQMRVPSDDEVRRDLKRWLPEYTSSTRPELKRVIG